MHSGDCIVIAIIIPSSIMLNNWGALWSHGAQDPNQ